MEAGSIAAIVLGSILGLIVIVGIIALLMSRHEDAVTNLFLSTVCSILVIICALIPIIFFSGGFFTDMVNQSFEYSKASIVALVSVILVKLFGSTAFADISKKILAFMPSIRTPSIASPGQMDWNWLGVVVWVVVVTCVFFLAPFLTYYLDGYAWGGFVTGIVSVLILIILGGNGLLGKFSTAQSGGSGIQINPYPEGLCDVPGFTWASNTVAPASIVLTHAIAWYHLMKNFDAGNNNANISIGSASGAVFLLQWAALWSKECLSTYNSGTFAPLVGYAVAAGLGSAGYKITKYIVGLFPAGGTMPPIPGKGCPSGYILQPNGTCKKSNKPEQTIAVGDPQATSAPVDDNDAFVCEAYKDGELITSTLVDSF